MKNIIKKDAPFKLLTAKDAFCKHDPKAVFEVSPSEDDPSYVIIAVDRTYRKYHRFVDVINHRYYDQGQEFTIRPVNAVLHIGGAL